MNKTVLETALEGAPVGFAVVEGPSMVFTTANRRYLEMAGRDSVVGRAWVDVFPELVDTPTHDAVRRAYLGEALSVAEFLVPLVRNGVPQDVCFSFTLDPIRSEGGVLGLIVVAVEVTELVSRRREAELLAAKLLEREQRYRAVFESIDDGFCVMQVIFDEAGEAIDYRFVESNDAFARHTGLDHPVGKTARELVPDLDEWWFRLYGRVAMTGEPARFESPAPAMNRWFEVFATRVGDPALRMVGLVFKDITLRKRSEVEKDTLLGEAQSARRLAEQASQSKDDFLAMVSHELRTPLSTILGWLSILQTRHVSDEKRAKALDIIERNARAQAQLIEDLLDISAVLHDKLTVERRPINLQAVVDACVENARPAAEAKQIELRSTAATEAFVLGDARRLQQVASNLLSNAIKFTPNGGKVDVLVQTDGRSVDLTVTDTGIGIAPSFLPNVFERFRQAEGGSARRHGGLGLGMAIVKHLVEGHGGTVEVSSEGTDRGARFTVRLPSADVEPASPSAAPARAAPDRPRDALADVQVLVVDDEPDSLQMLHALLTSAGATVVVASSAADALREIERHPPTVLISDIGMPEKDGVALIASVRSLPVDAGGDTPAIALTAYARPEDRTRCLTAGFSHYLAKPVEPEGLVAVVRALASIARRH